MSDLDYVRRNCLLADLGLCEHLECHSSGNQRDILSKHHIIHRWLLRELRSRFPEENWAALVWSNKVSVCRSGHDQLHKGESYFTPHWYRGLVAEHVFDRLASLGGVVCVYWNSAFDGEIVRAVLKRRG